MIGFGRSKPWLFNMLLSLSRDIVLPVPHGSTWSQTDTDAFLQRARNAGVSKIGFLRHGKTAPTPENGVDFDRQLTDVGKEQAAAAGKSFGKDLLPFHDTLLASPAPRTMDTAQIFLDSSGGNASEVRIQPVPSLYDRTMQPEGSRLFRKLGYAPLNDYVTNESEDDRESSRKVLGSYAHFATKSILETLVTSENGSSTGNNLKGKVLWVVGHAIYLPATALSVALLAGCDESSTDKILSTSTKEAEGFLVDLYQSRVAILSRQHD
ncbi:hypothetical protein ACA910_007732 [Epithemia clementina (nom. ined.)]